MTAPKQDAWLVYLQFAILLGIVALADRSLIRVGLAFVVGLMLVQRAVGAPPGGAPRGGGGATDDRRRDPATRDSVSRLLERVREFYAAYSLARSGQITGEEAMERTKKIERELNLLLDDVIRTSRGEPVLPETRAPA